MSYEINSSKIKLKLFPYTKNINNVKIDCESIHYISVYKDAFNISCIICSQLELLKIDPKKSIITDATACVGGNTISFAKYFKTVNAIEINNLYFNYLSNNIKVYELNTKVKLYNDNCIKLIPNLHQDVIYIDPPWGGKNYKIKNNLKLTLSNIPIETLVLNWIKLCKIIVLKLPLNYDLEFMHKSIINKIYVYELPKMFIVIVTNLYP